MGKLLDFQEIKQRYPIMDVVRFLGIELQPDGECFRGECPYCGDARSFKVTPKPQNSKWGLAGCFACDTKGVNCLQLVMDIKQFDNPRTAAQFIVDNVGNSKSTGTVNSTVQSQEPSQPKATGFDRARYQAGLDRKHESLKDIPADVLERADIGVSNKGSLKGIVLPLYDKDTGAFICYAGVTGIVVPNNVVKLRKSA